MQVYKHHDEADSGPGSGQSPSTTPAFARRHATTIAPRPVIGLAWYTVGSYQVARRMLADGAALPENFAQWESGEIEREEATLANGTEVTRVTVEPDALMAWCVERHLPLDLLASHAYAEERARAAAYA